MVGFISAPGLIGFLSEPDTELQVFALRAANEGMSLMWTEFAAHVSSIESLYEDKSFPERELAALVVSKIYYHLQEYDESMAFALGAGKLFNIDQEGEYEDTIIAKCIDTYIALSASKNTRYPADSIENLPRLTTAFETSANGSSTVMAASMPSPTTPFSQSALPSKSLLSRQDSHLDSVLVAGGSGTSTTVQPPHLQLQRHIQENLYGVIRRIFDRCFQEGAYRQVIGIAVEARNLDVLRETVIKAGEAGEHSNKLKGKDAGNKREELMEYLLDISMNLVPERALRNEILELILDLLLSRQGTEPEYFSVAKCIVHLGQHSMASTTLRRLVEEGSPTSIAVAYQISFDLYDNGTQDFLFKILEELPTLDDPAETEFAGANGHPTLPNESEDAQDSDQLLTELSDRAGSQQTSTVVSRTRSNPPTESQKKVFKAIRDILQGTKSIELNLEFLYRTNHTDRNVLLKLKNSLEARNSIFHTAVTFANAFMNSGTTSDWFFRENLDWLGKAVNWSKFTATAGLGVIHKGNLGQGRNLLNPYLPGSPQGVGSVYSQGGSLFALGIIYANHGGQVLDYLRRQFTEARDEVVQHGGALGLGVAGMATHSEAITEDLKGVLYGDSAINGQAVGLSIGLVMLGSGNIKALEDMIQYAHETEHEKITRGLALGMALIMYGRQEAADELVQGLLDDPDPTLRYGGIMTIALAYCGTGSNKAVRKLLHVAVSDVNDDVRRVAVMSLGFVLFRKPKSVPRMVELLAESYNPHVRYGATMALGIACAGTGLEEAVDLLEPMLKDSTDFVRQGACIALSMIMVQQSEAMNPKVVTIRKHLQKVVSDRHEDAMAKFGGAIALGIIDAGGKNCTIGLQTQTGNLNMAAIVGMAVFTQYWYWFPLTHFLCLSFTPTAVIGVDQDLDVPNFKFHCATRPSMFEYPPSMEVKTEEAPEKVKTAVLSTTMQAKRRKIAKEAKERQQQQDGMDLDQSPKPVVEAISVADEDKMDTDDDVKGKDEKVSSDKERDIDSIPVTKSIKLKIEKEKVGYDLENMSRILPAQLKYISFPDARYVPVKKPTGGVVLLTDTQPDEAKSLVERKIKKPVARTAMAQEAGTASTSDLGDTAATTTDSSDRSGGALAAAGVLTAADDDEDGESAELPQEFEYFTDGEDDE